MPLRQGTYWVVRKKSEVRHIQAYRDMPFPLCSIGDPGDARQVFHGSDPEVEAMPLCGHCQREARRVVRALLDAGLVAEELVDA